MEKTWMRWAPRLLAVMIVGGALLSVAAMLLWNWLVPDLFGGPTITFWQALGLFVLSRILFGGLRGGRGGWWRRHRMRERWAKMTPEEREKLRDAWRKGTSPGQPAA